jgi:chromosome segregation ATPase
VAPDADDARRAQCAQVETALAAASDLVHMLLSRDGAELAEAQRARRHAEERAAAMASMYDRAAAQLKESIAANTALHSQVARLTQQCAEKEVKLEQMRAEMATSNLRFAQVRGQIDELLKAPSM